MNIMIFEHSMMLSLAQHKGLLDPNMRVRMHVCTILDAHTRRHFLKSASYVWLHFFVTNQLAMMFSLKTVHVAARFVKFRSQADRLNCDISHRAAFFKLFCPHGRFKNVENDSGVQG